MRRRYGFVIVVIGFMITFSWLEGRGADWKNVGQTDSGEHFYDAEGITRLSDNVLRVWEKTIYTDKGRESFVERFKQAKFMNMHSSINLWEYNCKEKKVRFLSLFYYSEDGMSLGNLTVPSDWNPIAPQSLAEDIFKAVCK
ncbi:MAG TPA: surface-adhesin E family protein [Thermodesulfobacteriota bacterium]|nr:surface-adhesin E family protein [Thermodesulfobacteriota bacterium]